MNFKKDETAQKLRGGYYTDPDIASFLVKWALEKKPRSVLEPACGDGAFLNAIAKTGNGKTVERVEAYEIIPQEGLQSSAIGQNSSIH